MFELPDLLRGLPPDLVSRGLQDSLLFVVVFLLGLYTWYLFWPGKKHPAFHRSQLERFARDKPRKLVILRRERAKNRALVSLIDHLTKELSDIANHRYMTPGHDDRSASHHHPRPLTPRVSPTDANQIDSPQATRPIGGIPEETL